MKALPDESPKDSCCEVVNLDDARSYAVEVVPPPVASLIKPGFFSVVAVGGVPPLVPENCASGSSKNASSQPCCTY